MADAVLFIGWGPVVPGREQTSIQVFQEGVAYWQRLQEQGAIERFETVALEPHGGDLAGFALLHGHREQLEQLRYSDEFQRLNTRAALVVQHLGVVAGFSGEALNRQFASFQEHAAELT
jgi:hypothetical protein